MSLGAGSTLAKDKKKTNTEPESSPHYMIYVPEEDTNVHGRKDSSAPEPDAVPPSISSPERFMKSKPEREKSDLKQ